MTVAALVSPMATVVLVEREAEYQGQSEEKTDRRLVGLFNILRRKANEGGNPCKEMMPAQSADQAPWLTVGKIMQFGRFWRDSKEHVEGVLERNTDRSVVGGRS